VKEEPLPGAAAKERPVAVTIRLARHGRKKGPFYRIVVADMREARDGRYIELLGTYNPLANPVTVQLNQEKAFRWLGRGVQLSETVTKIFDRTGVLGRFKTFTGGEPLRDEEKKIETTIFNHPLDQHGSKGKGKKKRGATPSETKEEAKSVAAGEEASA
jgi:small subunit ribosomal protein S16